MFLFTWLLWVGAGFWFLMLLLHLLHLAHIVGVKLKQNACIIIQLSNWSAINKCRTEKMESIHFVHLAYALVCWSNHLTGATPFADSCCLYNANVYSCLCTTCAIYIHTHYIAAQYTFYTPNMGRARSRTFARFYEFTFGNFPKLKFISFYFYFVCVSTNFNF